MIAGLGHDVVNVAQFAEQMREGNGWRALFSVRELRQCSLRSDMKHDDEALHIAARWAGKEAVIKAWCEALAWDNTDRNTDCTTGYTTDYPYTLDNMPWSGIEILDDSHGCPRVQLAQKVQDKLCASLSLKLAEPSNTTELAELADSADSAELAELTKLTDSAKLADSNRLAGLNNIPNTTADIRNTIRWHISLTHDGSMQNNTAIASAVAMLEIL